MFTQYPLYYGRLSQNINTTPFLSIRRVWRVDYIVEHLYLFYLEGYYYLWVRCFQGTETSVCFRNYIT